MKSQGKQRWIDRLWTVPSTGWLFTIFISLTFFVILIGGQRFYTSQSQSARHAAELNLATITQLKADQISAWRAERLADAHVLMGSHFFEEGVEHWLAEPQPETGTKILARFRAMQAQNHYHDILLLDSRGQVRLSLVPRPPPFHADMARDLAKAFTTQQALITDLYIPAEDPTPHLEVIAPLFSQATPSNNPIGAVILRHEATDALFPLIKYWPTVSASAETILVRRDGDSVLYLNELRHQPHAMFKLRWPLTGQNIPAVQAALGKEGDFLGPDYRGVTVLAYVRQIPNSTWAIVAKMDEAEALAEWQARAKLIVAIVAALALALALAIWLAWQQRQRFHHSAAAAAALRKSEEKHRQLFEASRDAILTLDPSTGKFTTGNPAALQMFGVRDLAELNSITPWELAPERQPDGCLSIAKAQALHAAMLREGFQKFEWTHRRRDGTEFQVEVILTKLELAGQVAIQAAVRDITDRKQAAQALRESQTKLAAALTSMTDAVFISDLEGQFIEFNEAFARFHRFQNKDECAKKLSDYPNILDVFLPSGEPAPLDQWAVPRALRGESVANAEYAHRRKDTGETWVGSYTFSPIRNQAGVIVGAVTVGRDVTAQKQAEKKLAELSQYRAIGLAVLQTINTPGTVAALIQHILDVLKARTGFAAVGIRLQDREDFPYFAQQGFPEDFLQVENSVVERTATGTVCRGPDGAVNLECTCGLVLSGKTDASNPLFTPGGSFWTNDSFPILDLPPSQDPRLHPRNQCIYHGYASVALVPIRSEDRIVGLLQFNDHRQGCFSREMIEHLEGIAAHIGAALMRKRAEEALVATNQQLTAALTELRQTQHQIVQQEKLRGLGQMASGIAHDFNNALSPIVGFTELLLKYPEKRADPEQVVKWLKNIHISATDAARMVRRIREFSLQHPAGGAFQPLDLHQLIQQTIEITRPRWKDQAQSGGRPIQVKTDLAPVPLIPGEEYAIREVLTNLLFNAVDALPAGGTITLGTAVDGQFVRLWVCDTGTGMTAEVRQRCFEPFFTTKLEQGTGLGLAMVHGIIQRHGGTVAIDSEPDHGTTITIRLPIPRTETAAIAPVEHPALTRSLHVLVVDDEPTLCEVVEAWLTLDGHTVATAADGVAGLTQLKAGQFDLVITDKAMPDMSGEQLAAAIHRSTPHLPVVMMTGFGDIMKAGGQIPPHIKAILSKPVTQATLRETLAKVFPAPPPA